jgi:transposase
MTDKEVDTLPDDPAQLKEMLKDSCHEIERLKYRLALLQRAQFGTRSERVAEEQPTLFDLGSEDVAEVEEPAAEKQQPPLPKRSGHGRRRLPAELERTRIEHELPESQRACPDCGGQRVVIGWQTSEQVEYEPAKLYVIEHARAKYACSHCQEQVAVASKPAQPIEKGLAAPGLLAAVAVGKYGDHLPLYRMEEILARSGLEIGRSTQADWMRRLADLTLPVVERMASLVRQSRIIWTDDTTIPVLDPARDQTKTGRIWVYIGDLKHRYAVFDYTPDRKGQRPQEFLKGFSGYLQADAYSGYDQLCDHGDVTEVACWAHARRKFFDARDSARIGANQALKMIGKLYEVERQVAPLDTEARLRIRQAKSLPQLSEIKAWLDKQVDKVLPKSPLGQAMGYALNHWTALCRFTEDAELSIDNNLSERTLRCVAVGRKNWMFAGSDRGGRTTAVLMSLIATCKLLKVDPYRYLRDLFTRLPAVQHEELDEFLPDRWLAANPDAKAIERKKK